MDHSTKCPVYPKVIERDTKVETFSTASKEIEKRLQKLEYKRRKSNYSKEHKEQLASPVNTRNNLMQRQPSHLSIRNARVRSHSPAMRTPLDICHPERVRAAVEKEYKEASDILDKQKLKTAAKARQQNVLK
ncbi:unnamed protein product [Owenia fusiformis]|uniref:Uncharacterized protein n=1 Tax=Owenia fusiformis TaxID=6347 RepID=A0A8J1TV41_OWEFU|nr:unnamed protein product [Owenia fusiformis]